MTDQEYLQGLIDTQVAAGGKQVFLPAGDFVLTDTLTVTTGVGFTGIEIIGAGSAYRNEAQFPGTKLDATGFNDRPALKIAGARRVGVSSLSIEGCNRQYLMDNGMGSINPAIPDLDRSAWLGPNLTASSDAHYRPYQGIAIDPDVGDPKSSKVVIADVWIGGFVVGLGIQLQDHDANGDFVSLVDSNIEHCVVGIAGGNSQGRCFGTDTCQINNCHTALDTLTYGRQRGRFGGSFRNTTFESCIRIANMKTDWNGPLVFDSCYGENVYTFGYFESANAQPVVFIGGDYQLGQDPAWRGVPDMHVDAQGTPIQFVGTSVKTWAGFHANTPIESRAANFTTLRFDPSRSGPTSQETVNVHRWMYGGLVTDPKNVATGSTFSCRTPYLSTSGGWVGGAYDIVGDAIEDNGGHFRPNHMGTRFPVRGRFGAVLQPQYLGGPLADEKPRQNFGYTDFTDPDACVLDVTNSFAALKYPASTGDLMIDSATGVAFIITAIAGNEWTLEALTGFEPDGSGGWQFAATYPDDATGGLWKWYCTRVYTPAAPMLASTIQGQATMSAGWASGPPHIPGDPNYGTRVGDYLLTDNVSFYPFPEGATVTAIDTVNGTITMSHGAIKTVNDLPLTWWVRAPETNP